MTLSFLSPKPVSTTSNSVCLDGRAAAVAAAAGAIITAPPAAGSMPWTSFEVIAQFLGLLERQVDDLVAQLLHSGEYSTVAVLSDMADGSLSRNSDSVVAGATPDGN